MSYIEESLSNGEFILERFGHHWTAYIELAAWFVLGPLSLGLTWLYGIWRYVDLKKSEFGVTNKRAVKKTGIFSRHTEEMRLSKIETVEIKQGVWGRIFGFGTVLVTGQGVSNLVFKGLDDPLSIKKAIENACDGAG